MAERDGVAFPDELALGFQKVQELRYGENPHQRGAWYRGYRAPPGPSVSFAEVLQGKELSYNNLLDLDAALALALEFPERPAAVIIKHNTPCGVALDDALERAYRTARAVDEVSAFGGIVAFNREVDEPTARALAETFLEAVIAPGYSEAARAVLAGEEEPAPARCRARPGPPAPGAFPSTRAPQHLRRPAGPGPRRGRARH